MNSNETWVNSKLGVLSYLICNKLLDIINIFNSSEYFSWLSFSNTSLIFSIYPLYSSRAWTHYNTLKIASKFKNILNIHNNTCMFPLLSIFLIFSIVGSLLRIIQDTRHSHYTEYSQYSQIFSIFPLFSMLLINILNTLNEV